MLQSINDTGTSAFEYICKIRQNTLNVDLEDFAKNIDSLLDYTLNKSGTSSIYKLFQMELSHYRLMNIVLHDETGNNIKKRHKYQKMKEKKALKTLNKLEKHHKLSFIKEQKA